MDPNNLAFHKNETLYRRFEKGDLVKVTNKLKPNKFRLQFSVFRSSMINSLNDVICDKFNGIAEIKIKDIKTIIGENIDIHCIWDPTKQQPAHALIALNSKIHHGIDLEENYLNVCIALANAFEIIKPAT